MDNSLPAGGSGVSTTAEQRMLALLLMLGAGDCGDGSPQMSWDAEDEAASREGQARARLKAPWAPVYGGRPPGRPRCRFIH